METPHLKGIFKYVRKISNDFTKAEKLRLENHHFTPNTIYLNKYSPQHPNLPNRMRKPLKCQHKKCARSLTVLTHIFTNFGKRIKHKNDKHA